MRILGTVASSSREVPGAPTIGTATDVGTARAYNNGAASVTFTAPTFDGGLPITSYTVTSSPGGFTGTGASSPVTVAGLASSTSYTFTVTASNSRGTGAASAASNSITATTVPQAPTIGTATAGSGSATVTYTAGATGGKAVSAYTATSSPGSLTGTGASPITVSGLTNGTAYTFTVTATNANGTSAASSASNSVTPNFTNWIEIFLPPVDSPGLVAQIALDSSNNIYAATSYAVNSNQNVPIAVKMNSTGSLTWQKGIAQTAGAEDVIGIGVDSSNNVYMLGNTWTGTPGRFDQVYVKYNSSGTLQWQRKLVDSNSPSQQDMTKLTLDSSGNGMLCGNANTDLGILTFIDSSGTSTAKRQYTAPNGVGRVYDAVKDSSGNYYAGGRGLTFQPNYLAFISKVNSSNVEQWNKKYNGAYNSSLGRNNDAEVFGVAVDSSGNVYASMQANPNSAGSSTLVINKHNSSGTLQWTRSLRPTASTSTFLYVRSGNITVDSSGNVYVCAYQQSSNTGVLVKYDTSGTLQWQRTFTNIYYFRTITLSNDQSAVFINGQVRGSSGQQRPGFIRYPVDGSATGTYTASVWTTVIAASSYVDAAATLPVNTDTISFSSTSVPTISTSTYSEITPTGTVALTGI